MSSDPFLTPVGSPWEDAPAVGTSPRTRRLHPHREVLPCPVSIQFSKLIYFSVRTRANTPLSNRTPSREQKLKGGPSHRSPKLSFFFCAPPLDFSSQPRDYKRGSRTSQTDPRYCEYLMLILVIQSSQHDDGSNNVDVRTDSVDTSPSRCTLKPPDQRRLSCAARVLLAHGPLAQRSARSRSCCPEARSISLRAVEPLAVKAARPFLYRCTPGGSGAYAAAFFPSRRMDNRPEQAKA